MLSRLGYMLLATVLARKQADREGMDTFVDISVVAQYIVDD